MAKEAEVKLSSLVDSIVNYAPQKAGIRSKVFEFADNIAVELKKAKLDKPFRRAAMANLIRKDVGIVNAMEKAGIHKSDRYGRISMYLGHWIVRAEKKKMVKVSKDEQRGVWLTLI